MGYNIPTGLLATRSDAAGADMTFVWDVREQGDILYVDVYYGGGNNVDNAASAKISKGETDAVSIDQDNGQISVHGKLQAAWADNNNSYVVTFSGTMVRGNYNNVASSDLGTSIKPRQIIVYAKLN